MADGKYYWLKLKKDFFKRHDITILEAMPDGREYVLFYLKLMCESIDHEGELRFSENIPYTREMLASITHTPMEIVDSAIECFYNLGLISCDDDKTFKIEHVKAMIGSASDNDNARRQQRFRDRQKTNSNDEALRKVTDSVTNNNESKSKSKSKSKNNNIYVQEFDEVWDMYPKKQGKSNALKAYTKARTEGVSKDEIVQGLKNYTGYISRTGTEQRYVKMGSTWFNQRCWEDNYDDTGRTKGFTGKKEEPAGKEEDLDWFFD